MLSILSVFLELFSEFECLVDGLAANEVLHLGSKPMQNTAPGNVLLKTLSALQMLYLRECSC
jgi:hypothetical protein